MASLDWDSIQRALRDQGWETEQLKSGHYRSRPPDGRPMVHFGKSGDRRALKNTISYLRGSGFVWPPPAPSRAPDGSETQVLDPDPPDAPASQPDVEDAPRTTEQIFAEMREAREMVVLTRDVAIDAAQRAARANTEHCAAIEERDRWVAHLATLKKDFDRAFDAES